MSSVPKWLEPLFVIDFSMVFDSVSGSTVDEFLSASTTILSIDFVLFFHWFRNDCWYHFGCIVTEFPVRVFRPCETFVVFVFPTKMHCFTSQKMELCMFHHAFRYQFGHRWWLRLASEKDPLVFKKDPFRQYLNHNV